MPRLLITELVPETLRALTHPVELVDEAGVVLGQYVPTACVREPQLSREELERRLAEPGGRTLAEIMTDLEKRA